MLCFNSIQYVRHLHERMNVLENRTAPPKEEDTSADAAAAAMGYGLGMGIMGNETLMITNAPAGYGECFLIAFSGSSSLSHSSTLLFSFCSPSAQAATALPPAMAPASLTPTASPRAIATAALPVAMAGPATTKIAFSVLAEGGRALLEGEASLCAQPCRC